MQPFHEDNSKLDNYVALPVLAMRGLVFFPGMMLQFEVARQKSMRAVSEALSGDRLIFLVTQVDLSEHEPTGKDLYKIGVIARVKQVVHHSEDGIKLHVEGLCRGEIHSLLAEEPYDLMYIHYLMARVALWNGETERYNQFAALFEETYAAYRADTSRNAAWKDGRKIQM